jgi:ssDNA-binding Zn-finger/Zn-ribbon topoisomerase 1
MKIFEKLFSKLNYNTKNSEPNCPYCNIILDSFPERKKKCPKCGNMIFIKKMP